MFIPQVIFYSMFADKNNSPDFSTCVIGDIYLKLAEKEEELIESQKLRHFAFFDEPNGATEISGKIDSDEFDEECEHLIVMDKSVNPASPKVVGTYRLLRKDETKKPTKFYTEGEFDITNLKNSHYNILELGRSCIHPDYRDGKIIQLLWKGIGAFIWHHKLQYLFGCASFTGTNLEHKAAISYLHHHHLAPKEICPTARDEIRVKFDIMDKENIDRKEAFSTMPALLKGYIRSGCMIGEGAVLDDHCKTIDVCMVMDTSKIAKRYSEHFVEQK